MLPDYIIYDELKKERERRRRERSERPRIEQPPPFWPESEFDGPDSEEEEDSDRGVEIIQI